MSVRRWAAHGVSRAMIPRLVRSGDLVRLRRGVYATRSAVQWAGADQVRTHVLHLLAARATLRGATVVGYQSAAVLHRLDLLNSPAPGQVTLIVPLGSRWARPVTSGVLFRAADVPRDQLTTLYGLPVTTAARTVADLARTLPFTDAVVAADCALRTEKMTKWQLDRVLGDCARWPGVRQARRVLEFADERAESPLESAARVVFRQHGLEPPELQATIRTPGAAFRVDFLWPGPALVAEADGRLKYAGRADLVGQLERDRKLRDAGFRVVHFTWKELFGTPETVVAALRRAAVAATAY